jgi:hypothetical protein
MQAIVGRRAFVFERKRKIMSLLEFKPPLEIIG